MKYAAALLLALAALPAGAVEVELLSRVPPQRASETVFGETYPQVFSADGRFLVFLSKAQNLVAGVTDANLGHDVFLFDRDTEEVVLVSRSAGPVPATGNRESSAPAISADGRFVAFASLATDLVPGQVAVRAQDVFLWDRLTGQTELVSHAAASRLEEGNGASRAPALSADGRFVAFESRATDLVSGFADTNGFDVFLYDRLSGEIVPVSRSAASPGRRANGPSTTPAISADGRFVAFVSRARNLVAGQDDRNGAQADIFLWDRTTGTSVLVSHADGAAQVTADGTSESPWLSADGRFVAYHSAAANLVARQSTAIRSNVFLFDRRTGTSVLVSHAAASPTVASNGFSGPRGISADGSYVLFTSTSTNLVAGQVDTNHDLDVFLYARSTGKVTLVSHSRHSPTRAGDGRSNPGALSADGRFVLFDSSATDLTSIPVDERSSNVFLWDRVSGRTVQRSVSGDDPGRPANGLSYSPLLSADGSSLAYLSQAPDLVPGLRDASFWGDIVFEDRAGTERVIVTRHAPGLASSTHPSPSLASSISGDGRFVVFASSDSELIPGLVDASPGGDVFLRDRATGKTTLVSHAAASPLRTGNRSSQNALISADGRFVAYESLATDLVPEQAGPGGPQDWNIFLWDRETDTTTLVSHAVLTLTTAANSESLLGYFGLGSGAIAADGSTVIFLSRSTDLVFAQPDDPNVFNAFAWDRASGRVTLVSGLDGAVTGGGVSHNVVSLSASADGRIVAFSTASRLVTGVADVHGANLDVFLHDRTSQTTTLLSRAVDAAEAVGGTAPQVSADGRFIAFTSHSSRLIDGQIDDDASTDLFLHDRISGTTRLVSHVAGSPLEATAGLGTSDLSADGRFVAFTSDSARLVAGQVDGNGVHDTFLYDRESGEVTLVSRAAGTSATAANRGGGIERPQISADGRRILFVSRSSDLVAGQSGPVAANLFVFDRTTGETEIVSRSFASPTRTTATLYILRFDLAASGSAVALTSDAPDLVPNDFNQLPDAFVASLP